MLEVTRQNRTYDVRINPTFCRQNEPALASQSFLEVFLLPTHFERRAISRFRGAGLTIWAYFLCCENTCGTHKIHIFYQRPISHDSFTKLCTLMVRWSRVQTEPARIHTFCGRAGGQVLGPIFVILETLETQDHIKNLETHFCDFGNPKSHPKSWDPFL